IHWAYITSYCCCSDICAKPEVLAPATVPKAAPEAAPIPAPRPPPMAPPSAAPSAVLRMAPPTAWLLAAYAAGAVSDAAYCWQNDCSAAKASKLLFGPGATGMLGPNGGATHPVNKIAAVVTDSTRRSVRLISPPALSAQADLAASFSMHASDKRSPSGGEHTGVCP